MTDILQQLTGLEKKELSIILNSALDDDGPRTAGFLHFLKAAAPEARVQFLKKLPGPTAQWIEGQLEGMKQVNSRKAEAVAKRLEALLVRLPALVAKTDTATRAAMKRMSKNRQLLRADFNALGKIISDQQKGLSRGELQKPYPQGMPPVDLPPPESAAVRTSNVTDSIKDRASRRKFSPEPLSLDELSYLLWATQGIKKLVGGGRASIRTVPSGGAMHAFETYLAVNRVEGLKPGLYRYQPVDHKLAFLFAIEGQAKKLTAAALGQGFVGDCGATFIWSAVPYRCEWRYTTEAAKLILLDAGHVCQNLYLACEALGLGTCAIGAYDQKKFDALCHLDGVDEMVVYLAPVGRV